MAGRRVLRGACGGSNNAFTAGNGHYPGATPGTREEPGDRPLARVPGPGGRRAARGEDQATGQPARRGRARPLHLIHGGAVPDSARQERLARAAPGNRGNAGRDDRGSGRARARFPGGRAGPEAVSARAAAPATDPCRTAGVRARKTGCRAVASSDASGGPAPRQRRLPAGDQLLNLVVDGDRRLPLRLVAVVAQAEGQRWRRLSPGSLSVSGTRRRRDHGERDGRQAPGDAGRLSCRVCGEYPVPAVGGDVIQAQARSASCVPAASRNPRHADLPARHENVLQALLCITMWITCVKRRRACVHIGEMLGIPLPGRAGNRASPGRARSAPCGRRRKRNCPHATPR
jgi:hypothetical protein